MSMVYRNLHCLTVWVLLLSAFLLATASAFAQTSIPGTNFTCTDGAIFSRNRELSDRRVNRLLNKKERKRDRIERKRDRFEEFGRSVEELEERITALEETISAIESCLEDDSGSSGGSGSGSGGSSGEAGTFTCPTSKFAKQVNLFQSLNHNIRICATSKVSDAKVLHAARVMAEYLDNNEDGTPDNADVATALTNKSATLVMFANESDEEGFDPPGSFASQNLYARETVLPGGDGFDFALEEILHIISHEGYAAVYPNDFGEEVGTTLANAMDTARGGRFTSIPSSYPNGAWYTYDDNTCDYGCQATEYFYWAFTSMLGAQNGPRRLSDIEGEWRLNTLAKVQATDTAVYNLITRYQADNRIPTVIPDGTYSGETLSIVTP
ncbi:MAG: hypothetical protein KDD70_01680 [Bdellovibrionales bacterium]|nr:hypothetical protein [Bdellovibrionales bacterium]